MWTPGGWPVDWFVFVVARSYLQLKLTGSSQRQLTQQATTATTRVDASTVLE